MSSSLSNIMAKYKAYKTSGPVKLESEEPREHQMPTISNDRRKSEYFKRESDEERPAAPGGVIMLDEISASFSTDSKEEEKSEKSEKSEKDESGSFDSLEEFDQPQNIGDKIKNSLLKRREY